MFGDAVTFSYRALPSKKALFLAIAEQAVETLLVHIISDDGVAHLVIVRYAKVGRVDLGPSRLRIGRIAHDGAPSREGRDMWLIGALSLASSSTFAATSRLAETEDHGEAGSKRSFVLIGDKCNARGGKATRWERQIRQKESRKGERGCG